MHKVFIDSDVLIDVFAHRDPFFESAARVLSLIDKNQIEGYTSPIVIANLHYILSKLITKEKALRSLRKLRSIIRIISIDEKIIDQALNSDFSDFEDSIPYYTANSAGIEFIITRNKDDYRRSKISVCTPEEYLMIRSAKE